jgi:hypothetical protein
VLSAVLRIATHPAIFKPASPRDAVEAFIDTCLAAPAAKAVRANAAHWALFRDLCTKADCRGNLIQDGLPGCHGDRARLHVRHDGR